MKEFDQLLSLCEQLLSENGCPWDKKQTFLTLKDYLLDEAKEVAEAVDKEDVDGILEELGDLIYTIIFFAKVAEKRSLFSIKEVLTAIYKKMVFRHPHIFANKEQLHPDEIAKRWKEIKKQEKKHTGDNLKA